MRNVLRQGVSPITLSSCTPHYSYRSSRDRLRRTNIFLLIVAFFLQGLSSVLAFLLYSTIILLLASSILSCGMARLTHLSNAFPCSAFISPNDSLSSFELARSRTFREKAEVIRSSSRRCV